MLEYLGHEYVAHGELKREPATTGHVDVATVPACDDGNGAAAARQVQVTELTRIPPQRAVLAEGSLYIRVDLPFPELARAWFVSPSCATGHPFELTGDWLGVNASRKVRFDGDLRPPYRVSIHVTQGPRKYVGATVQIRATAHTDPTLGPDDVKTSLWEGGSLSVKVQCAGRTFEAIAMTSAP